MIEKRLYLVGIFIKRFVMPQSKENFLGCVVVVMLQKTKQCTFLFIITIDNLHVDFLCFRRSHDVIDCIFMHGVAIK